MMRTLTLALACLALAGCGDERHLEDVKQFVKESENLPRGRIEALPEVRPYEPFEYAAYVLLDPFEPRKPTVAQPTKRDLKDPVFDPNRRKGPLEAFPLENLRMVGTLQQKKDFFALIKTPDNNLYRVKAGDFMGQNFGRITDINESALKLIERIGDDFKEEERTMLLQDEGK